MKKLINNLPKSSPIRPALICYLAQGVSVCEVASDFGLSTETIRRAKKNDGTILQLQSIPNQKKPRITQDQEDAAIDFLDEVLPVVSGRDYRILKMTQEKLYELYIEKCNELGIENPLGKTYFFDNILGKQKLRKSKDETICSYCKDNKEFKKVPENQRTNKMQETIQKTDEHIQRWYRQANYYKYIKQSIADGTLEKCILVVHDFTQIKAQGTFFQDLIICFYSRDPSSADNLQRKYFHFVGKESSTKNDIGFVVTVWKELIDENYFNDFEKIYVFSDGGGKHFKLTANVCFFGAVQKKLKIPIEYNYFESNHGHSVCDSAAAQAKKELNEHQRNNETRITTSQEIAVVISNLQNHEAFVTKDLDIELEKFKTFNTIRSMFKFLFTDTQAKGFKRPDNVEPDKVWNLPNFQFF